MILSTLDLNSFLKKNYFQVFDLPFEYNIDFLLLNSNYTKLQKLFHPDNFINQPTNELAILASAHINNAYSTLKSPLNRAIELLKHYEINLDLSTDTNLSHEFLLIQMELHENIAEAKKDRDKLNNILHQLITKQQDLNNKISAGFINKDYSTVIDYTKELAFYNRLENLVNTKIENLW